MTKNEFFEIKDYFTKREMIIISICLLFDIIIVQLKSGIYQKYNLKNFRK